MESIRRHPNVMRVERELEERYYRAVTRVVRYGSGLEEAQEAYYRLSAFKDALAGRHPALAAAWDPLDREAA